MRKNEQKKKKGKERKNGGERKSRTPVMPRDGMRIEEPGRRPWYENEKKKKRTNGGERKSRTSVMPREVTRKEARERALKSRDASWWRFVACSGSHVVGTGSTGE